MSVRIEKKRINDRNVFEMLNWRDWSSYLLCFIESPDSGVRAMSVRALGRLLNEGHQNIRENRTRILTNFLNNSHFPKFVRDIQNETLLETARAFSLVYRSVFLDAPLEILAPHAAIILPTLVFCIMHEDPIIAENGAAAMAAFTVSHEIMRSFFLK